MELNEACRQVKGPVKSKKALNSMQYQPLPESKSKLEDYKDSVIERFLSPNARASVRQLCALGCPINNAWVTLNFIYQHLCRPLLPSSKQVEEIRIDGCTALGLLKKLL